MRTFTLILTTLCLFSLAKAEPPKPNLTEPKPNLTEPKPNLADLAGFMEGGYTIVGKKPNSKATYLGHLSFHAHGQKLDFVRTVHGHSVRGTATFDTVAGADRIPVLRLRFPQDGRSYEGTYLWACDYDNYFRFTGYVYSSNTKDVGLEMFFPVPPSLRD